MKPVTAALLVAMPFAAAAQDLPKMRAGLWQTTTMTRSAGAAGQSSPQVTTICLDDSVQKLMLEMSQGMMRGMCSRHELRISGDTISGDAVCDLMGSRITTRSVMKFSGDARYHTDAHMTYDPPLNGRTEADTVVDGKYTGPCPAGMSPGDIRLKDGKTINLKALTLGR